MYLLTILFNLAPRNIQKLRTILTVEWDGGSRRVWQGAGVGMREPLVFVLADILSPRYGENTHEIISCVFTTSGRMA